MRECPRCAEHIIDAAVACRYCGYHLTRDELNYPSVLHGYRYRVETDHSVSALDPSGADVKFFNWRSFWDVAQTAGEHGSQVPPSGTARNSSGVGRALTWRELTGWQKLFVAVVFLVVVGALMGRSGTSSNGSGDHSNSTAAEIEIGESGYLRNPHGKDVFVFISQDGMSDASQLEKADADTLLLMQYVACVVPNGTKILNITGQITGAFMSGAGQTRDVMVVAGPNAGCKGTVRDDYVTK